MINVSHIKSAIDIVTRTTDCPVGQQVVVRFKNGYGASIVENTFSYGTELAVVKFNSLDVYDFDIVYDTPITNDVIVYLRQDELTSTLKQIEAL